MFTKHVQGEPANAASANGNPQASHRRGADLKHEFKDLIADVEELISQTASLSGDELKLAQQRLTARLEAGKEMLTDLGSNLAKRARSSAAATNTYVHEQPWKAVAIGATVGLLLGVVLARR